MSQYNIFWFSSYINRAYNALIWVILMLLLLV